MAARNSPPDPDGSARASTTRVAKARKAKLRATKASASARPPDLDARNQNMARPRKPMGPQLKEGPPASAAVRQAATKTRTAPTDPKPAAAARRTRKKTRSKKRTAKKSSAPKRGS